jgi:hypothetical protein
MARQVKELQPPTEFNEENLDAEAFLAAAAARQDLAIEQLEKRLDELGDDFAARVRTMVERGLMAARRKALQEIRTIDVGFFLQTDEGILRGSQSILTESQEVSQ